MGSAWAREESIDWSPDAQVHVASLLLTGARRNEVLHAQWDDFDVGARQWVIPKNKSARPRYIPLPDAAIRLLEQVNSGRSLYEVQHLLGHARPVTTQRYSHLTQQTLLDATNQAASSLGNAFMPAYTQSLGPSVPT